MDISTFSTYAVRSAKTYLDYLKAEDKGLSTINVKAIENQPPCFHIKLMQRLPDYALGELSSLGFKIDGVSYPGAQVNPTEYDRKTMVLTVHPQTRSLGEILSEVPPEKVQVFSDLRFLVDRVRLWYTSFGETIQLPPQPRQVYSPDYYGPPPTPEQKEAITGVLSAPFSYVWGAPGTGKTRCVLANCVLKTLLADTASRILLIAPTNNAVEQMLFGLIPILLDAGIKQDQILRLGLPSSKFAAMYSFSCESQVTSKIITSLKAEKDDIEKYLSFAAFKSALNDFSCKLPSTLEGAQEVYAQRLALIKEISLQRSALLSLESGSVLLQRKTTQLMESIHLQERSIASFSSKLRKLFHSSAYAQAQDDLESSYNTLAEYQSELDGISARIDAASLRLADINEQAEKKLAELEKIKCDLLDASSFYGPLRKVIRTLDIADTDNTYREISSVLDKMAAIVTDRQPAYAKYSDRATSEWQTRLRDIEARLISLSSNEAHKFDGKRIVAATIDRCIRDFSLDHCIGFIPSRIFMDEAAYCSLVKGATLFAARAPVTFFGDHMQLPPVCEMNDESFGTEGSFPVFLWAQSAIYIDSIFHKSIYRMCDEYLSGDKPDYVDMIKFDLTETHRFGSSVSSVLASTVYSDNFRSAAPIGTEIIVLDAPFNSSNGRRTSISECKAIKNYIDKNAPADFVVLTPYRKQLVALTTFMPQAAKEGRIMTVHASQGQEYDTVILSVVDTSDMYFTDSNQSKGKRVINTAISRAKKRLVIACDQRFWSSREDQLISKLIAAGSSNNK